MQRFVIAAIFAAVVSASLAGQEISPTTEFTQVSQSPPYLNCRGRLGIEWQGSVLMRGRAYIRDAAGQIRAETSTGQFYSPSNPLAVETEYGTQNGDIGGTWTCSFEADVIIDYGDPQYASAQSQDSVCPGTPGEMRAEYATYGVNTTPACNEFVTSGGSTHFSWSELNGGFSTGNPHSPYGVVKGALTTGLESTRTNYNRGGVRLSSGYRCPHGNASPAVQGAEQSLHMQGRAADMYSNDHTWTEGEFALLKAAADNTSPAESLNWDTYTDHHYHAAW